jgi:SAM-dependent methyltransferase
VGFEADWLAAREPYDEAALDPVAVGAIERWGARLDGDRTTIVVDLGSGTGAALGRVQRWLAPREIVAFAVDHDPTLLASAAAHCGFRRLVPIVADLLEPLEPHGGPADGTVDIVVGHALADLVPLDRLATRAAALVRPGGLVHLALAYDGLTAFSPAFDPDLDRAIVAAFHYHMDRPAADVATYGGTTAGRRLGPALAAAGLEIVVDAPSVWNVRASDGDAGRRVLARLIRFVVEAVREIGGIPAGDLSRWVDERRTALATGELMVRVSHRDVLARAPEETFSGCPTT